VTRLLPNFLIIGAMKAGTTSLYQYCSSHPQISMSAKKEVHFFSDEANRARGRSWYEQQFAHSAGALAVGEASTSYSKFPAIEGVPGRIIEMLPNARFIYLIRHPIERIQSQYVHHLMRGKERRPMAVAVRDNPDYLDFSRYSMQIEQYLEFVSPDRILVVRSENLRRDRIATLHRIFTFLGVDPDFNVEALSQEFYRSSDRKEYGSLAGNLGNRPLVKSVARAMPVKLKRRVNSLGPGRPIEAHMRSLPDDIRSWLENELRDDVERLSRYGAGDVSEWGIA